MNYKSIIEGQIKKLQELVTVLVEEAIRVANTICNLCCSHAQLEEGPEESSPMENEIKANQQVAKDPLWDLTSPK